MHLLPNKRGYFLVQNNFANIVAKSHAEYAATIESSRCGFFTK